jgi:hypothetical protein
VCWALGWEGDILRKWKAITKLIAEKLDWNIGNYW